MNFRSLGLRLLTHLSDFTDPIRSENSIIRFALLALVRSAHVMFMCNDLIIGALLIWGRFQCPVCQLAEATSHFHWLHLEIFFIKTALQFRIVSGSCWIIGFSMLFDTFYK